MSDDKPLTRDEALLALNNHIGQEVELIVQAGVEMALVISAKGTLRHWRDDEHAERWGWHSREEIAGLYDVGSASLDISDLHSAWLLGDEGQFAWGLSFFLAPGAALSVVWGVEPS
jgi:hypothetical protein